MYIALWVVTGIFAALFAMAGSMKVVKPYAGIREQMEWVETVTPAQLKGIGIVEVLGAIGLILPAATGIAPWLTPVAAVGLLVTMIVATALHVRRKEPFLPSLILGACRTGCRNRLDRHPVIATSAEAVTPGFSHRRQKSLLLERNHPACPLPPNDRSSRSSSAACAPCASATSSLQPWRRCSPRPRDRRSKSSTSPSSPCRCLTSL